jgi:hypothetical protein
MLFDSIVASAVLIFEIISQRFKTAEDDSDPLNF